MTTFFRFLSALALVFSLSFMASSEAEAAGPMGRDFGIGISLGNPTSLTGKYYLGDGAAFDFHVGTYSTYNRRHYRNSLFLAADYLVEVWHFVDNGTLRMPFYAGIGGLLQLGVGDRYYGGNYVYGYYNYDFGIGARVPVGTALQFKKAPFEVFLEVAPTLSFLFYEGNVARDTSVYTHFDVLNFAIGARFYF